MGTTLTTLNLYGAERSAIDALLLPADLLRDQNPPWLTVVPPFESECDNLARLEKAAKLLTKQSDAAALLFHYFDDDVFSCTLYQNGKKSAACQSYRSWAKLGKALGELLNDEAIPKAFRYAVHLSSLEEQLELLEETIGTALYQLAEDEPRKVVRSDAAFKRIKAREAMLKKRPNKYKLTELQFEDWPPEMQYRQKLFDLLRPQWDGFGLSFFLYDTDMSRYMVPGGDALLAYSYMSGYDPNKSKLLLMNAKNGECRELGPFDGYRSSAVYQTKSGGIVVLLPRYNPTLQEPQKGRPEVPFALVCINRDNTESWRFQPELPREQMIQHVYTSERGIITLFADGLDGLVKSDARIFMIDGETGELLHTHSFSYKDHVDHIIRAEAMDGFLLCKRSKNELLLLDDALAETRVFDDFTGSYYFKENQLCGSILWEGEIPYYRSVMLYDIRNKTAGKTNLEIPAYPIAVLRDGRILCTNEKQNVLIVFGPDGILLARCPLRGMLGLKVVLDGERICLVEVRGPDTHGFVYDELFDETSIHVWRLDPVSLER